MIKDNATTIYFGHTILVAVNSTSYSGNHVLKKHNVKTEIPLMLY